MRLKLLILVLLIALLPVYAQETEQETLISGKVKSGWSVGSYVGLSTFNNQTSITDGFRAEWIINGTWLVGWQNYQSVGNNLEAPVSTNEDEITMDIEYRGIHIGRMFKPAKLIHWGIEGLMGWGDIDYNMENGDKKWNEDYFYTVQPAVSAEVNLLHWLRIMGSIGYRFVTGVDIEGLGNSDINGPVGGVCLRFGDFR